ncbi:MAG TPA: hypothetical protein VI279_00980 [Rhodocyclaceae bacterium]
MSDDKLNADAANIDSELARKAAVFGLDWSDDGQVRKLARLALANNGETIKLDCSLASPEGQAKMEIFGLAQMALKLADDAKAAATELNTGPALGAMLKALQAERQNRN